VAWCKYSIRDGKNFTRHKTDDRGQTTEDRGQSSFAQGYGGLKERRTEDGPSTLLSINKLRTGFLRGRRKGAEIDSETYLNYNDFHQMVFGLV
jgi:hypothetical protein